MSTTQETREKRSSPAGKVPHFTPAERAARGKAARAEVTRRSHGEWEPSKKRPDTVGLLEEQAATRVPELRSDPVRADARLAVHVLPRRRLADGVRPGRRRRAPDCTRSSAVTRTCRTSASTPRPTGGSSSA